jgi:hypothetical protein
MADEWPSKSPKDNRYKEVSNDGFRGSNRVVRVGVSRDLNPLFFLLLAKSKGNEGRR